MRNICHITFIILRNWNILLLNSNVANGIISISYMFILSFIFKISTFAINRYFNSESKYFKSRCKRIQLITNPNFEYSQVRILIPPSINCTNFYSHPASSTVSVLYDKR